MTFACRTCRGHGTGQVAGGAWAAAGSGATSAGFESLATLASSLAIRSVALVIQSPRSEQRASVGLTQRRSDMSGPLTIPWFLARPTLPSRTQLTPQLQSGH